LKVVARNYLIYVEQLLLTPFVDQLIQARELDLVNYILRHDPPITITNEKGQTCLDVAQRTFRDFDSDKAGHDSTGGIFNLLSGPFSRRVTTNTSDEVIDLESQSDIDHDVRRRVKMNWHQLIDELTRRNKLELENMAAQADARLQANAQHRDRQRALAADARARVVSGLDAANGMVQRGLGTLDEGWGYFPSLAALQFQQSIPPPSASFADVENKERRRLEFIVKTIGCLVFVCFLLF